MTLQEALSRLRAEIDRYMEGPFTGHPGPLYTYGYNAALACVLTMLEQWQAEATGQQAREEL